MRYLSRDPFARTELVRFTVPNYNRKLCHWCGNAPGRFQYAERADSLRSNSVTLMHAFCSKSCHDSFHS